MDNQFTHFVGIKFVNGVRSYFFGVNNIDLKLEDKVVVETSRGVELGSVSSLPVQISEYQNTLELKPVIRKATESDIRIFESNIKDAEYALKVCQEEVNKLNLEMRLTTCEYTLDKAKVIFSYVSDDRVDFRELLKSLAARLHTRIELRQIGTRDKAKMIGGLGMCGLPLCCSTFLNEFDGISINRAKNQMLAINIPKLSGHCGKLMCCLKYEDDAYTDLKKYYPEVGKEIFIDKTRYVVGAINVISRTVRIDNEEGLVFLSLEEFKKQTHWHPNNQNNNNQNHNNSQQNNQNHDKK